MVNKRTLNSKTWINFDGSYTTEIFSDIVHYEDENGLLQNINTDLYDEADFDIIDEPISLASVEGFKRARDEAKQAKNRSIMNRANYNFKGLRLPFEATIPRNFKKGYSIGKGANKLAFKPVNASPSISELYEDDRSRIIYQDVWNDTDVELKVQPNGIKETLYLKTEKAPTTFSFEVEGPLEDDLTSGEMKLEPAWLQDANGTKRDVSQTIRRENDKTYIDLVADVSDLIYPIEVDPTVTLDYTKVVDTYIDSGDTNFDNTPSYYIKAGREGVGTNNRSYYGLLKFDLTSIPVSDVSSAIMTLHADAVTTSGGTVTVGIYEATKAWAEEPVKTYGTLHPVLGGSEASRFDVLQDGVYKAFDINLTSLVNSWVNGIKTNNGVAFYPVNLNQDTWFVDIFSSENNNDITKRPKLSVIYNRTPTTPTVTIPNGGENWNSLHTIAWNASTDADGDSITYEIQLTTDNSVNWKTLKSGVTGTSTTYDFINEAETSTAKIRIRAYDGMAYSAWDESNGVFTIQHNFAPTAPTNLTPSGGQSVDRAQAVRLSWQHNDTNANDPQSKFNLQWRVQGQVVWNEISQVTTNQFYDITGLPHGIVEWQVRTYDQANLSSPYSGIAVFIAGDKPSIPTIIAPVEEVVPIPNPVVQWSSSGQVAFHVKLLDINNNLVWESQQNSTNKALTVGIALTNNTDYKIQVAIKNDDNLWSDFATKSIYVAYTPPKKPTVTASSALGHIVLEITNPIPEGTEPEVIGNDIYKLIDGEWVRIAEGVLFEFRDYAVPNEQTCEYFVRANGETGAFADSNVLTQSTAIEGVWLHDITDAEATIYQFKNNTSRSSDWEAESETMNFVGRKRLVIEMGEMDFDSISFELKLKTKEEIRALERIVKSRNIVCYRDGNGRLLFGMFTRYPSTDELFGQTVDLELMRIDYTEKV